MQISTQNSAGIVVIGRNEAANLESCLKSCLVQSHCLVYADSDSTDDSIHIAARLKVPAIRLDDSLPMTAARGRNSGFDWLMRNSPGLKYVQFVDGDCELAEDWLTFGIHYLDDNADVAIVYGQLRERYSEQSVYNLLADIEWSTPAGEASACGGIFLVRVEAFQAVGGFRTGLVGGEEPEMCIRLMEDGWKLYKLNQNMACHDADMHHFSQWWKRSVRDGYTFAEGVGLHGRTKYRHFVRETLSAVAWAGGLPVAILILSLTFSPVFLYLFLIYPVQVLRVSFKGKRNRMTNLIWSFFLSVRKFPELLGVVKYSVGRLVTGKRRVTG